jgi:NADPH:quinone reductase-like Zn-dependent oxidoreductase
VTTTLEMVLPATGEPEVLQARRRELDPVGPGQARVRVEATGVSFAEQSMRRGKYYDQPEFPFVPGYDLVGTVEELGSHDTDLVVGQRVAALTKTGGWAEQVVLATADLVPVPATIRAAAAETVIVNGLTALRVLRRIGAAPGATVVVLGAAGGVGSILVQLAFRQGLRVIGTAGPTQ